MGDHAGECPFFHLLSALFKNIVLVLVRCI